jgi:hypothetical protein
MSIFPTGRDHGLPSWIQMREKCGLQSDFKSFDDLKVVFPTQTVKLLEKTYESVQDIDLFVGGALESFKEWETRVAGPTFSCIYRDQFRRFTSGDAYFFTHSTRPNAFNSAQLAAIKASSVNQLMCASSNIESVNKYWQFIEGPQNPKVPCSQTPQMDLSAWKEA